MTRWEPCHPERTFSIILRPCHCCSLWRDRPAAPFENCGKGMIKPIKDRHPDINIVAIDYDAARQPGQPPEADACQRAPERARRGGGAQRLRADVLAPKGCGCKSRRHISGKSESEESFRSEVYLKREKSAIARASPPVLAKDSQAW